MGLRACWGSGGTARILTICGLGMGHRPDARTDHYQAAASPKLTHKPWHRTRRRRKEAGACVTTRTQQVEPDIRYYNFLWKGKEG